MRIFAPNSFLPDRRPFRGLPLGVAVKVDASLHDERVLFHDEAEAAVVDGHEDRATDVDSVFGNLLVGGTCTDRVEVAHSKVSVHGDYGHGGLVWFKLDICRPIVYGQAKIGQ